MATNATWTVIFEDKVVIKNYAEGADEGVGYVIDDDSFWSDSKWSNIWAIQYGTLNPSDAVEYRDTTPHSTWEDADLGSFQDFITKWDSAHLAQLQANWDADVRDEAEKGARPTSYSSE